MAEKGCALHHWVHDVYLQYQQSSYDSDRLYIDSVSVYVYRGLLLLDPLSLHFFFILQSLQCLPRDSSGSGWIMSYDCIVTIQLKLRMIPKIKERISSSKKQLDLFKRTVFGKWLDLNEKEYDNHLLNYVLHHQRPGLSKSIDSNILFDINGHTLLLERAKFFLVTGFACGKVVFLKTLDDGIALFVRRVFPDKLKKLEKKEAGLGKVAKEKAAKGKAAQLSDKGLDIRIVPQQLSLVV
ncbi:hypothetical protein Tco_1209726 [Tanacetum coccineum]